MKNIIKIMISIMVLTLLTICTFNKKDSIKAASLWLIEGTTIVAYNGEESVVTVPEGMTKIGEGAFTGNTKINKVILPDTVKEIGMRAFASCNSLSDINLENISKIGEVAFEGTAISEVVFSDEIIEIPIGCFAYATVKKVTLGANVTTIASSAFYNCRTLEEINFSNCLYSIGAQAFYQTYALQSIKLPEGLSVIGSQAFYGSAIENIEIPGSVEVLEAGTFSYCQSLKKITFNEGLKEIGSSLIYDTKVKEIYIPSTVETIGVFAFGSANEIEKITVDENNSYFDSDNGILYTEGYEKVLMIPHKHPDKVISLHDGVKESEEQFAANLVNVEKIIIPEGFVMLNHNAFTNSKVLEEVVLPDSLEIILSGAFSYCDSLYTIKLPNNLKELSNNNWWIGVFDGCVSLKEVVIPDSVEKIGPYTFKNCTNLERVVFPAGLTEFGYKQFSGCANLQEIIVKDGNQFAFTEDGIYYEIIDGVTTLSLYPAKKEDKVYSVPENVTAISDNAFDSAANLEEITITKNVISIGTYSFSNTISLKKVTIEAGISVLPEYMFVNSSIEEVILPNTLTEIGRGCFMNTTNLKSIKIPDGVKVLANMIFYQSGVEEIELPDSVTEINQAFYYATNLKKIKLSNNITTFVASSFNNCPIEEITIPTSMVEIAEYSFVDCPNLKAVYVPESTATIYANSFYECNNLIELTIDPNNQYFIEENGILYDVDKTKIIFINQERLSEVIVLPDTLLEIGPAVFKDNQIIKEITIPASVQKIEYNSFTGCQIEKAIIAEGTISLPNFLFRNCTKLKEVILPESLENINAAVFSGCTSLETIEIADTVNIDTAYSLFSDCVNLKYVKLPSTMKVIPQYMFSGCISLETIEIPESVVEIETHFVAGCDNIEVIIIPESVTSLEYDAFVESSVEKVIFLGNAPALVSSVFGDVFFPKNLELYVFKNANGFSDKSYRPYIQQFKYLDNDIFKDESVVDAVSIGEHQILIETFTIYANLYKYYVKNDNGEYELLAETKEPTYLYEALVGNKTYDFKVDMIIKKGSTIYTTTISDNVFVSKTYEEYMLDYLILEMISLVYSAKPTYEEVSYVMEQYYELNEIHKEIVNKEVDVALLQNKYEELLAYKEDIDKITTITLNFTGENKIKVGETTKLNVIFPEGVVNKEVTYTLDKVGIIDIQEDGSIYAIKEGKVKITVTALSGVKEEIELTIIKEVESTIEPDPDPEPITEPEPKNCSCKGQLVVQQVFAFSSFVSLFYLIKKRGAKNA